MIIDDVEINLIYDNGKIVSLEIRCKRDVSISRYIGHIGDVRNPNVKKHYSLKPYVNPSNPDQNLGIKFICDPSYEIHCIAGQEINTLTIITKEKDA